MEELEEYLPRELKPDRTSYTTNAKQVTPLYLEKLKKLVAADDEGQWKEVSRILNDPTWYKGVKQTQGERNQGRCSMAKKHWLEFKDAGFMEALQGEPLGFVHMFLVPEDQKRRWRIISHTLTVNRIWDFERFSLPTIEEIREAVKTTEYGVSLDMKSWFHQFQLDPEVRNYYATYCKGRGWQRLRVLPMGARASCALAQFAIRTLTRAAAAVSGVKVFCYIDNVLILGDKEQVEEATRRFEGDCAYVGATINLGERKAQTTVEYCGMVLHLATKEIEVSEKTIGKAKILFELQNKTVRLFSATCATLAFMSRVTQHSMSHYYDLMQFWRKIHQLAAEDEQIWDKGVEVPSKAQEQLRLWYGKVMENKKVHIRFPSSEPSGWMIVDASEKGWSGILLQRDGTVTVATGNATSKKWGSSTKSEPWGWYNSVKALTTNKSKGHIVTLTDHESLTFPINKGRARHWHYNEVIRRTENIRPELTFSAIHIPGECNIADPTSRGEAATKDIIEKFKAWINGMGDEHLKRIVCGIPNHIPYRIGTMSLVNGEWFPRDK